MPPIKIGIVIFKLRYIPTATAIIEIFKPPFSFIQPCVAAINKLPENRNAGIASSKKPPIRNKTYAQIRILI